MTESPDPQLQFKKRARRRLVGAIAFAGLAAVVLPMVMDEEPKQPAQDVQIRIPGQDQPPLRPPLATLAESSSAQANSAAQGEQTTKAADEASARSGEPHAEAGPAAVSAPPPSEKAAERKATRPAEKPAEKAPEKKTVKPAEKAPEKGTEKKVSKPVDKAAEKPVDKPAAKVAEKPPVRKADKPTESGSEETGKAPVGEAHGKAPDAAPAKASGQQVILIGAFANRENAEQLQRKISAAGVSTYTEILETPEGRKTRVRAGPFPNREAADKALEKLKRMGVTGVVAGRQ
ncbi:MAG: SPOR domain-containing protein [Candidatus Accumulibacter sp.]|jgi:DedD protein|nr:SPOR domain-containing protein [Accumulibacter sp.]